MLSFTSLVCFGAAMLTFAFIVALTVLVTLFWRVKP